MQQQKEQYTHKIKITSPAQIETLEVEGHEGLIESTKDGTYLLCTKQHGNTADLAGNLEESLTRKPQLNEAEKIMEGIGSV